MKKLFATVLLASVAVVACHGKKSTTAPPTDPTEKTLERKDDATGGAKYGGRAPAPSRTPEPTTPH
jgi:hypothetical protein